MSIETVLNLSNILWLLLFLLVSAGYFVLMINALSLTTNKFGVLFGPWFLDYKSFPTEEGKRCCKFGALLVLILAILVVARFFYWREVLAMIFRLTN